MSEQTTLYYQHILSLYDRILRLDEEELDDFIFSNPVLLSKDNCYHIFTKLEEGYFNSMLKYRDDPEKLYDKLQYIIALSKHFLKQPEDFPFGIGPVETIWRLWETKEISLEYAQQLIKNETLYISSESYIYFLCRYCEVLAQNGDWRKAVPYMKILRAGILHRHYYPWHHFDKEHIVLTWLEVVTRATNDVPDVRLFNDALTNGVAFIGIMNQDSSIYPPGALFHRLAVLHQDSYFSGKNLSNYTTVFQSWQMKLRNEYGDSIYGWKKEDQQMPNPEDIIPKTIEYGRKAAKVRTSLLKARSQKVILDAMLAAKIIEVDIDTSDVLQLAEEANTVFKEFPEEQHAYDSINTIIEVFKDTKNAAPIDTYEDELKVFFESDTEALFAQKNKWTLLDRIVYLGKRLNTSDPQKSIALLSRYGSFAHKYLDDQGFNTYLNLMASSIFNLYIPTTFLWEEDTFDALLSKVQQTSKRHLWEKDQITAAELKVCSISSHLAEEKKGLALMSQITKTNPDFIKKYQHVVYAIQSQLYSGEAVNQFDAHHFTNSVAYYTRALRVDLLTGRLESARTLLYRIEDIIIHQNEYDIEQVTIELATEALYIQTILGYEDAAVLEKILKRLFSLYISKGAPNAELLTLLIQLKKGLRFADIMDSKEKNDWQKNIKLRELDEQIKQLQHSSYIDKETPEVPSNSPVINDNMIISAVYGEAITLKGDTIKDKIRNLQQVFDAEFQQSLMINSIARKETLFKSFEAIKSKIPEKTILINYNFGQSPFGNAQIYIFIMTNQEQYLVTCDMVSTLSGKIAMEYEGKVIQSNMLTFLVGEIRNCINEEPGFKNVSSKAMDLLAKDHEQYFGGTIPDVLNELKEQGKDHICIVPCDTLFFYPFHLTGKEDDPMAKHWKISYLPTIQSITNETSHNTSNFSASIFGIRSTESAPSYMTPLEHAEEEANVIADILGVTAIVNDNATESAFYEAMTTATYVHLATHGEHNVYAPCYHAIYLKPSPDTDGIVHAYELYGKDFSNVELLTLSACETALGRVDISSNLYGLPAAFFHAGVKTIVGTLWPVETRTSAFFFTTFYENLKQNESKIDAFYSAQKETRHVFPQYRDWGAFYYTGHF